MSDNRVSAVLTEAQKGAVETAVQTLRDSLPFLISLSREERQQLPKFGDKSVAFVSKAAEVGRQNPDLFPRRVDLDEIAQDFQLWQELRNIQIQLAQLMEMLDDTTLAVGSEAYAGALEIYRYLKASGDSSLDGTLDELGKRFTRRA